MDDSLAYLVNGQYFTGEVIETCSNGQIVELTTVVNGEIDGPVRAWYPDGSVKLEMTVVRGRAAGVSRRWHPNGRLADEREFDEKGNFVAERSWTANGEEIAARPTSRGEAEQIQLQVAANVVIPAASTIKFSAVAGLDVSYAVGSDQLVAAAVVVEVACGAVLEEVVVHGVAMFPYAPGLLAFREVPILVEVLARLRTPVDLLLCDGQGIAHPRRCGLASHLGIVTGHPAVGCAKNHFVGEHDEPGPRRGDRTPLVDGGEVVGEVLTQDGVRPVYVSPGHRIGVAQATDVVLALTSAYRLPDPVRRADHISRAALRG